MHGVAHAHTHPRTHAHIHSCTRAHISMLSLSHLPPPPPLPGLPVGPGATGRRTSGAVSGLHDARTHEHCHAHARKHARMSMYTQTHTHCPHQQLAQLTCFHQEPPATRMTMMVLLMTMMQMIWGGQPAAKSAPVRCPAGQDGQSALSRHFLRRCVACCCTTHPPPPPLVLL